MNVTHLHCLCGLNRFESYDISAEASLKVGKRFRITAANVVNINLSSAAVDALVGAALSWRKQGEFEQKARMVLQVVRQISAEEISPPNFF